MTWAQCFNITSSQAGYGKVATSQAPGETEVFSSLFTDKKERPGGGASHSSPHWRREVFFLRGVASCKMIQPAQGRIQAPVGGGSS